jgi:hypothetical protein
MIRDATIVEHQKTAGSGKRARGRQFEQNLALRLGNEFLCLVVKPPKNFAILPNDG